MKRQTQQMGACGLTTSFKFIMKSKRNTKLTKIPYSFFLSSKCVKIVRLAIQWNPIN